MLGVLPAQRCGRDRFIKVERRILSPLRKDEAMLTREFQCGWDEPCQQVEGFGEDG
jgi:hypothetical protein